MIKIIKKIIFEKRLYKEFLFNIGKVNSEQNALLLTSVQDDKMEVMFLLNGKLSYFIKNKDEPMKLIEIDFNLKLDDLIKIININDMKSIILKLKYGANIVNKETVINVLINTINNHVNYYKLTHKEMFEIYSSVNKNKEFFQGNSSFFIENTNNNLWLD